MTGPLKIISVTKSSLLNSVSDDLSAETDIVYNFEIIYGTEAFQVTDV
jgi:hypothetical protein